jgi:hypothetical protein
MEVDQVQARVVDNFKFRAREEMLLRDDEIERLKEKRDLFQTYQISSSPSHQKTQYHDKLKREHFHQGADVKLMAAKMRVAHAALLQNLREAHESEIQKLEFRIRIRAPIVRPNDHLDSFIENVRPKPTDADGTGEASGEPVAHATATESGTLDLAREGARRRSIHLTDTESGNVDLVGERARRRSIHPTDTESSIVDLTSEDVPRRSGNPTAPESGRVDLVSEGARNPVIHPRSMVSANIDIVGEGARELELAPLQRECREAEVRIRALQGLLVKFRSSPLPEAPANETSSLTSSDALSSSIIENMKELHAREMARMNALIATQRKRARKSKKALKREIELSESIIVEQAAKADRQSETWDIVVDASDQDKQGYVDALRAENTRLMKEIARLDFTLYGRHGNFRKWRPRREARSLNTNPGQP